MTKFLTISAHPDDEVLAVGGTIAYAIAKGYEVHAVVVTDGSEGYTLNTQGNIAEIRRQETLAAHRILGISETVFLEREELTLNQNKIILKQLVKLIRQIQPSIVLTHCGCDPHVDHKDTHDLVVHACLLSSLGAWPDLGAPWRINKLYTFEVIRGLLYHPTHFVDITTYMPKKMQAMAEFRSQVQVNPALTALVERIAEYRGAQIGSKYAEALAREFPFACVGFEQL